jgi:DnaJ-class molecular chaperone
MLRKNHYLTLGVTPNESAAGVREAFRDIIKRYHPDRIGAERLRFFQEIIEAYHVLADPERRSRYDCELFDKEGVLRQSFIGEAHDNLPQSRTILRAVTLRDAPFEAALALISGRLKERDPAAAADCRPLNARVILRPEEAAQGGVVVLEVPSCTPCARCGGSGCDGVFACEACDGEGLIEDQEVVRLQIPAMVSDGALMNVPLRGLGVHNFYLRVQVRVAIPAPQGMAPHA